MVRSDVSWYGIRPYVHVARVDHWFKNVFMLLGVLFAFFYVPEQFGWGVVPLLTVAIISTCLVVSSNYVLNELVDGSRDAHHPVKKHRPVPSGLINKRLGYLEWIVLGALGLGTALLINQAFAVAASALWMMGILYNVPPVRTKDWAYLDVLTESVNNPLRLALGWFTLVGDRVPPISLVLSYWMVGAFFMAAKRLAEYRQINSPAIAAAYRSSFAHYSEDRLLVSLLFYATSCALFAGIFIVRYHAELILFIPIAAALFALYLKITLQPDSPAQHPERLLHHRRFVVYAVLSAATFVVLLFVRIPMIYDVFNLETASAHRVDPLWTIGPSRQPPIPESTAPR